MQLDRTFQQIESIENEIHEQNHFQTPQQVRLDYVEFLKKKLEQNDANLDQIQDELRLFQSDSEIPIFSQEFNVDLLETYLYQLILDSSTIRRQFYTRKIEELCQKFSSDTYVGRPSTIFDRFQLDEQHRTELSHETIQSLQRIFPENRESKRFDLHQKALNELVQATTLQEIQRDLSSEIFEMNGLMKVEQLIEVEKPVERHQFQLASNESQCENFEFDSFFLQPPSIDDFSQALSRIRTKDVQQQILQTELNYLQKQYTRSIHLLDASQQRAIEETMKLKLQRMREFDQQLFVSLDTDVEQHQSQLKIECSFTRFQILPVSSLQVEQDDRQLASLLLPNENLVRSENVSQPLTVTSSIDEQITHGNFEKQPSVSGESQDQILQTHPFIDRSPTKNELVEFRVIHPSTT